MNLLKNKVLLLFILVLASSFLTAQEWEPLGPDDDNDETLDEDDAFPLDPEEDTDTDTDEDGTGDNADLDDDDDGFSDEIEITAGTDPKDANSFPEDTDSTSKSNEPTLVPAELFTPNGDGMNDTWVIPGIENYPNSVIKVYNRWRHEIFASNNYKNDWGGVYNTNTEKLPAGSYLYIIDLGNGTSPLQGWIFINY